MNEQINEEYARKTSYAARLADDAWLANGLDGMAEELRTLRRNDADQVILAEVQRLYYRQCIRSASKREAPSDDDTIPAALEGLDVTELGPEALEAFERMHEAPMTV